MREIVAIWYRGATYQLGRGRNFYGIWPLGVPGSRPFERWPLTTEGWYAAWSRFAAIERPGTIVPAVQNGSVTSAQPDSAAQPGPVPAGERPGQAAGANWRPGPVTGSGSRTAPAAGSNAQTAPPAGSNAQMAPPAGSNAQTVPPADTDPPVTATTGADPHAAPSPRIESDPGISPGPGTTPAGTDARTTAASADQRMVAASTAAAGPGAHIAPDGETDPEPPVTGPDWFRRFTGAAPVTSTAPVTGRGPGTPPAAGTGVSAGSVSGADEPSAGADWRPAPGGGPDWRPAHPGGTAPRLAALAGRDRRAVAAAGLLAAGVVTGIAGLFPGYLAGTSLAQQPFLLVPHVLYLAVWGASALLILLGGTRMRAGALLATAMSIVTFGFFFADAGTVIAGGTQLLGAGLVLGLIGWLACAAGSVTALRLRPGAWLGSAGRPVRPHGRAIESALVLGLAAAGAAIALIPAWDSFTLHVPGGTTETVTQGYVFANPGAVIAGNVMVMVALVAVVVAAALWRPVLYGAALLAGAVIPMAAQAVSALIQIGGATSPAQFGIPPAQAAQAGLTISSGVTAAFWIYSGFVVVLAAMCALMLARSRRAPAVSASSLPAGTSVIPPATNALS